MGYGFTCDICGDVHPDGAPPLMGEFRESFLKTDGGTFAEVYDVGQTVTLCEACCGEILL